MKKIITLLFSFFALYGFAQNQIDIVAKWNENDTHNVQFVSEITDTNFKNSQKNLHTTSVFDSNFLVNEVTDSYIKITWTYTKATLDSKEKNVENIIISKLINQPLKIRLSKFGKFEELENAEEIRNSMNRTLDNELAKTANEPRKMILNIAKNLIAKDQNVILIVKNIKAYLLPYEHSYIENEAYDNNITMPNPFGGESFPAQSTVEMTSVNEDKKTCILKSESKVTDTKRLMGEIIKAGKKVAESKKSAEDMETTLKKMQIELSDNSEYEINYDLGVINKGLIKRTINSGIKKQTRLFKLVTIK